MRMLNISFNTDNRRKEKKGSGKKKNRKQFEDGKILTQI